MLIGTIRRLTICLLATAAAAQVGSPAQRLPDAPSAHYRGFSPRYSTAVVAVPSYPTTLSPAERPYKPLTSRQKLDHFVRYSYSPYTLFNVLYDATYAQANGDPSGYGGGMQGYGKRVGASLVGTEAGSFFGMYLFPS